MAPNLPIFMDNHSTTRCDPRVLEAMLPYFDQHYGNAASMSHSYGWAAEAAVDFAREQVADLIGGSARDIVFTSGATESDNLAIKGAAYYHHKRGDHVVTVETEHKAVIDSCKHLAQNGYRVTFLRPDHDGLVSPEQVAEAVDDGTIIVSVMFVNNEIGVVQPIADIARAIKAKNPVTFFHCDAVQGLGKLPFVVDHMGVDLVSLTAHKMYGPKGIGALWVRGRPRRGEPRRGEPRRGEPRVRIQQLMDGGGHERGMRSGTLPVPLIVGFGKACEIAGAEMATESARIGALRDRLHQTISSQLSGVSVNGSMAARVSGNLNLSFAGVDGESLLMALKDVAVSSGSACTSATQEPSYVLRAIGVESELAQSSIRFGIGRFNTEEEIDFVGNLVVDAVRNLRELAQVDESASPLPSP